MISHLTYLHDFLDNYILCYGNDGHVAVENTNDSSDCESNSFSIEFEPNYLSDNATFHDDNCNDVSLHNNCVEDNQFLLDNKTSIPFNTHVIAQRFPRTKQKLKYSEIKEHLSIINPILESYTTVSLII